MSIKAVIIGALLPVLVAAPAAAQLTPEQEAFRQKIVEESRAQSFKEARGLDAILSEPLATRVDCGADAAQIEALVLGGNTTPTQTLTLLNRLPQGCVPGETRAWVLVEKSHFTFTEQWSYGGAGGASGFFGSVGFGSLLACVRGAAGIAGMTREYRTASACLDPTSGTVIPTN